jgi:hypothetical protein
MPCVLKYAQVRRDEGKGQGSEIKKNTFLFQEISLISVEKVEELIKLIDGPSLLPLGAPTTNCWV